ncbi:hypothetical protein ACFYSJ_39540 [Streptomyces sp. NPDC005248]|uniref:hypothetical protein n=1 Tax=Streptomyces sp. NPDC005248 TaxID=3364709 RepID=UPI0036B896CC
MRIKISLIVTVALTATLTACSTSSNPPSAPAAKPTGAEAATLSPEAKESARVAAALPPEPDAETRGAFLAFLDTIDPDIVHGKGDKAISRGLDTCATYRRYPGEPGKQLDMTNKRWSSPSHPDGHGRVTAEKILNAAHMHLCPDY